MQTAAVSISKQFPNNQGIFSISLKHQKTEVTYPIPLPPDAPITPQTPKDNRKGGGGGGIHMNLQVYFYPIYEHIYMYY